MTELSPAAQAVLDAALPHAVYRYSVAAALRAAAGQVQPSQNHYDEAQELATYFLNGVTYAVNEMRRIADELKGAQ